LRKGEEGGVEEETGMARGGGEGANRGGEKRKRRGEGRGRNKNEDAEEGKAKERYTCVRGREGRRTERRRRRKAIVGARKGMFRAG